MAKTKKPKPKFLTFKVIPKVVKRPRAERKIVQVRGTVKTTSNKQVVDITLIPPKGKILRSTARYLTGRRSDVVSFYWPYPIHKHSELYTYTVKGKLRENRNQKRTETFRVTDKK